jgi:sulfide dehydrogenase cytochrome subunit
MSLFRTAFLSFSFIATCLSFPAAQAEVTRGEMLANSCTACHGTDGQGSKRIPRINNLDVADTIELMKSFKQGGGGGSVMTLLAPGYTDEEIRLIAEYFANMTK